MPRVVARNASPRFEVRRIVDRIARWPGRLAVAVVLAQVASAASAQVGDTVLKASDATIVALRTHDWAKLASRFDANLREKATLDRMVAAGDQLDAQVGAMGDCKPPSGKTRGATTVVEYRCAFAKAPLLVRLAWNDRGELSGYFFAPAPQATPPAVGEESLTAGASGWPLPALLQRPVDAARPPVAVLVHGSGPNDRDETIGPNKVFADLAAGLAARGVATLRYDKRTRVHATRLAAERPDFTLDDEVVDDAVAALALVTARRDLGPVFVVGHSQGAWLAPRIAARAKAAGVTVAGLVMLSGNASSLADVLVYQYRFAAAGTPPRATAEQVAQVEAQRDDVARLVATGRVEPGHDALPEGLPPSYWLDVGRYDPVAALLAQRGLPALLTFGERDYQVPLAEKDLWAAKVGARPDTTIVVFPRLNHLLIEGDGPMGAAEYATPGHVAPVVAERVAAWIAAHAPSSR